MFDGIQYLLSTYNGSVLSTQLDNALKIRFCEDYPELYSYLSMTMLSCNNALPQDNTVH